MSANVSDQTRSKSRLAKINLDTTSLAPANDNMGHEREVAIFDLLEANSFEVEGKDEGPYQLNLAVADDRLVFDVQTESSEPVVTHPLPLTSLKRVLKDYFLVIDSYYKAVRDGQSARIEELDAGRRSLHDEGSRIICERLNGTIRVDTATSRRLFTLIAALHWKG